ncbi:MAG: aldo/keto reductase [Gammaproteobacteria bacterium]|nr:aldo/keto reductase [Gammaproteobacteria bacterium]
MKLILGTMTFGDQVEQAGAETLLQAFTDAGHDELDSAHAYCEGRTEEMLGRILPPAARGKLYLASKVNPWHDDGLQPVEVKRQMAEILQRLGSDSVDLLYLHSPDLDTPAEQTLEACFELYQQGRFRHFGLSNYAAWQVAEVAETCRRNGWMEPTVYQGMYNALTRDVERELFPCLHNYGIRFYAYNPLAGGLLTGKHLSLDDLPDSGRFSVERSYLDRYWKKEYFDVLREMQNACAESGLKPVAVAMSWLINHSRLDATRGDGIILGASSLDHLRQNMAACEQAPLDASILDILDRGWEIIKPDCFRYFRP